MGKKRKSKTQIRTQTLRAEKTMEMIMMLTRIQIRNREINLLRVW